MPLEFSRIGIEREQRIAVEIVARAPFTSIGGRRIAGWPKDQIGGGIVDAGDPSRSAASLVRIAFPGFLVPHIMLVSRQKRETRLPAAGSRAIGPAQDVFRE
jgi:hypothetical protein